MQKILVTGGSNGIGRATISKLLMTHNDCYVINLDLTAPQTLLPREQYIECDVSNLKCVQRAFAQSEANHNYTDKYDGIFSNAGIHMSGNIETLSFEDIQKTIDTNLMSTIYVLKTFLPHLHSGGAIVLNASDQSLIGKRNNFAYGLTKGALGQMTKALALDLADRNIRVNAVCPGTIESSLYHKAVKKYCQQSNKKASDVHQWEAQEQPLGRIGQPEEVASLVLFLLNSTQSGFMTGCLIPIDGGYSAK